MTSTRSPTSTRVGSTSVSVKSSGTLRALRQPATLVAAIIESAIAVLHGWAAHDRAFAVGIDAVHIAQARPWPTSLARLDLGVP